MNEDLIHQLRDAGDLLDRFDTMTPPVPVGEAAARDHSDEPFLLYVGAVSDDPRPGLGPDVAKRGPKPGSWRHTVFAGSIAALVLAVVGLVAWSSLGSDDGSPLAAGSAPSYELRGSALHADPENDGSESVPLKEASDRVEAARKINSVELREVTGQLTNGGSFVVDALDHHAVCLALDDTPVGCSAGTGILPRSGAMTEPGIHPTFYGVATEAGGTQLVYGHLGSQATDLEARTAAGEPYLTEPVTDGVLWAVPVNPEEPGVVIFFDAAGRELREIAW